MFLALGKRREPPHLTCRDSAKRPLGGRSFSSDIKRRREAPSTVPPHPQQVFEFLATMAGSITFVPRLELVYSQPVFDS